MNIDELLRRYDRDDLDPRTLSGDEFQNVVFIRMFRKLGLSGVELRNFPEGEVDFAVALPRTDSITQKRTFDEWHLFECKNYKRTIEFATAAKLMLIGLRWQVQSINLVSRTELQKQAKLYAARFFRLDDEVPEGEEPHPAERKIGAAGSTIFRHFITRDLVGFEPATLAIDGEAALASYAAPPTLQWCFTELQAYSERILASSDSSVKTIRVRPHQYYRLEATLEWTAQLREPTLGLLDSDLGWLELCSTPSIEIEPVDKIARFAAVFRVMSSAPRGDLFLPRLGLSSGNDFRWARSLPITVTVLSDGTIVPDMRPEERARFAHLFDEVDTHLVVLTGEAGTGKSWLCDHVAESRRAFFDWDVLRFDAMENAADSDLIEQVAVNAMLPARLRIDDDLETLARNVIRTLTRDTADDAKTGRNTSIPLFEFVAKSFVESEPRLLIIRNCERLSHVAARDVLDLVHAIERRGWGDVHIVLEGREGSEAGEGWNWLCTELLRVGGVRRFPLQPMTHHAVETWLKLAFEVIPADLRELCWHRAGGYPLFLQSLLECWKDRGAIRWHRGRWRIVRQSVLREQIKSYSAEGPGNKSEQILLERVRGVTLPPLNLTPPFNDARFVIGLFALAETSERISLLAEMLPLGDVLVQLTDSLRDADLLDPGVPKGELRFRHDRLREAADALAREADDGAMDGLLRVLPSGDTLRREPLELLGDLQLFARQPRRAWVQYQEACGKAMTAEAFLDACRITAKQQHIYERYGRALDRPFIDYLRVLEARAWSEWNCGSTRIARDTYSRLVEDASNAADGSIDSTLARVVVCHAAGRIAGIDLELADVDAFATSAAAALREDQDAGDFNAVMNRLVLACAQYGLPKLAEIFIPLSLAYVTRRQGEERWQAEFESVALCAIGELYMESMPDCALAIFREAVRWSRAPRQRLGAEIDALAAEYLATGNLDAESCGTLHKDAVDQGIYVFLAPLNLLRGGDALCRGNLREAKRLLDQAQTHITIQDQPCYAVSFANNALIYAMRAGDRDSAEQWTHELVRVVKEQLQGRERVIAPLSRQLRELAVAQWSRLALRYPPEPLRIMLPTNSPPYCGGLFTAWFNLRRLDALGETALADIARSVTNATVPELDIVAAEAAFGNALAKQALRCSESALAVCIG